ncbi:MAG: tautomerase family protein [Uliginosibacterium sp.]|nr:tautomerase family protein [Uliginosibacterium sp.]
MAQIKIHGLRGYLSVRRQAISDVIHACSVEVLQLPGDKRFHRFEMFDAEDFIFPAPRTEAYTIVEVLLMSGRTVETRKRFIRRLFEQFEAVLGISPTDLEICLIESAAPNWGFRGLHGDEAQLSYSIKV